MIDRGRLVVLHDLALVHHRDPVGQAHRLDLIVGDIDGGGFGFGQQPFQLGAHFHTQQRVEIGQRFVHQQHLGFDRQRPRHGDALALAAGQLAGVLGQLLFDVHHRGGFLDFLLNLVLRHFLHAQAKADVVEHCHVREHRVVLKYHGDTSVAWRQAVDRSIADFDHPAGFGLQPGDDAQQRRLAAAGCAQEYGEFLGLTSSDTDFSASKSQRLF